MPRYARLIWWMAFCAIQVTGYVLAQHANVHTNPFPLLLGVFLLSPGSWISIVFRLVPDTASSLVQCAVITGLNIPCWYLVFCLQTL
jgi:hypothetical protein